VREGHALAVGVPGGGGGVLLVLSRGRRVYCLYCCLGEGVMCTACTAAGSVVLRVLLALTAPVHQYSPAYGDISCTCSGVYPLLLLDILAHALS
jgi:hypothetical protein